MELSFPLRYTFVNDWLTVVERGRARWARWALIWDKLDR